RQTGCTRGSRGGAPRCRRTRRAVTPGRGTGKALRKSRRSRGRSCGWLLRSQVSIEMLPQGETAAMKARLNNVDGDVEYLRRLSGGQFLDIAQENDGAVDLRKRADTRSEGVAKLGIQEEIVGEGGPVGDLDSAAAVE